MQNLLLLFMLLLLTSPVNAALYRWVDEYGKVHYSDKEPVDKAQKSDLLEMRRGGLVVADDALPPAPDEAVTTLRVEPSEQKTLSVIKTRLIPQPEQQLPLTDESETNAAELLEAELTAQASQLELEQARERLMMLLAQAKAAEAKAKEAARIAAEKLQQATVVTPE
ncbi:MAG: DUF4124 domain-containing protein [Ferrimonas sp.]